MSFHPNPKDELTINNSRYFVAEHPSASGMPYGQEGRTGIVYRLSSSDLSEDHALKVFKPRFRLPYLVSQAEKLSAYAGLPGLQAARRSVLSPSREADLLRQYPDLTYAVLMPWLDGPTWLEILLQKKPLLVEQSLSLYRALTEILVGMEERGLAHCDLSGPNVLLPALVGGAGIALIDLEGFYAPGMLQPQMLPSGSAGYTHQKATGGLWGTNADRFAGAVLLAEMLGWCDQQVCLAAWGESYFAPDEILQEGARYHTLDTSLRHHWGDGIADLFARAWRSDSLADCPTFGEWLVMLPLSSAQVAGEQVQKIETLPAERQPVTSTPIVHQTPHPEVTASVKEQAVGKWRAMPFTEVKIEAEKTLGESSRLGNKAKAENVASSELPESEETPEKPIIHHHPKPPIQRKRRLPAWAIVGIVLVGIAGLVGALCALGALPQFLAPSSPNQPIPTITQPAALPVVIPAATEPPVPIILPTTTPLQTQINCNSLPVCKQVEVLATKSWQSFGVTIQKGQNVRITYVSGTWAPWPGADSYPYDPGSGGYYVPQAGFNALVAKIGSNTAPFLIDGESYQFLSNYSATLYLQINDNDLSDESGSIIVLIEVW